MSKGLFTFFITCAVVAVLVAAGQALNLPNFFSSEDETDTQATFTGAEVLKMIDDWPVVMTEVDSALEEYRRIGGNRSGEAAIRRGVQRNTFARLGWADGRGEYLISYLYMLRNAMLKYSEEHRALGYFMEHYEQNEAVSAELKAWQIDQIAVLLEQINSAPELTEFPAGDVELMSRYYDRFHAMLVNYGRQPALAQR